MNFLFKCRLWQTVVPNWNWYWRVCHQLPKSRRILSKFLLHNWKQGIKLFKSKLCTCMFFKNWNTNRHYEDPLKQGWPHFLCGGHNSAPKKNWRTQKFVQKRIGGQNLTLENPICLQCQSCTRKNWILC